MSLIGGTTKGNSDSLATEETEFAARERRTNSALFSNAPKEIHFELKNIATFSASSL
jgi:hypothetical protein